MHVFELLLPVVGWFNLKASQGSDGRKNWRKSLSDWRALHTGDVIWMHCASLGEFEQGRPLLEAMRYRNPNTKLLLTFFSPSGYEIRKNFSGVDGVFYLPIDTGTNASDFLNILNPSIALVVKYEYWPNFFLACKKREIPLYVVSCIFRSNQRFFGLLKGFWRPVLASVTHFFVQNSSSKELLHSIDLHNVSLTGDTRFDRVMLLKHQPRTSAFVEAFKAESLLVIGGSTWPADEEVLAQWMASASADAKLVVVPHEVGMESNLRLRKLFPEAILWSQSENTGSYSARVLIVDEIGWLSSIYAYADICWIGGGFGTGIHNTLEAAVWNKPVLFGPRYLKFDEACGLISAGGAISAKDATIGPMLIRQLALDADLRERMGQHAGLFVSKGVGATQKILSKLGLK